ncbi:MAG TPA: LamG-like jellyroll fold domain-containing protein [Solirubrobacteraceae bacterium]|jgi:hypothetical protein|nr:LamG-like jellyroll fold domain-containing protein [Solirubrobacteraceae bacterium]
MPRARAYLILVVAMLFTMGLASASASADSSVVGLWHFDEGAADFTADSSGLGNNGTLIGGVNWTTGVTGSALTFDGTTGEVNVPASPALAPANITVQAWVKRPGSPGTFRYVIDKGYNGCVAGSYGLYTGPTGGLFFYVSTPGDPTYVLSPDATSNAVWDNQWHLVTGTYDGTALRIYVDGQQVGSGTSLNTPISYGLPNNDLYFGSYLGCAGLDYPGMMDNAEIWNRALSPTDVAAQPRTLTLSPPSATVRYGAAQTYAATGINLTGNDLGDVTPATTFSIGPDGTCSGASCTPASVGSHTVTGYDNSGGGTAKLDVTAAPLTVTANNVTRPFGTANPALGATITGFVLGQNLATSGVTGAAACSTTATTSSTPGNYPITCTQGTLTAANYSFPAGNFVAGTLTVAKAGTSIALPSLGVVNSILAVVPALTATLTSQATGAPIAGQPIAFSFSAAPRTTACTGTTNTSGVASCRSGLVSIVTVLLSSSYSASYAGNSNYAGSTATAPVVLISSGSRVNAAMRKLTGHARVLLGHDLKACRSILAHKASKAARKAARHRPRCVAH